MVSFSGKKPTKKDKAGKPSSPEKAARPSASRSGKKHLIHDVPVKNKNGSYNVVVEIPTGTVEKYETDKQTGQLYQTQKDGSPRRIGFLSYPGNYGFIPQTLSNKELGGDGDPVDVIVLSPRVNRGKILPVRILGGLRFLDEGEQDDKLIAIPLEEPFVGIHDLPELMMKYPGAVEIVKTWFESYDGLGTMTFQGYVNRQQAEALIDEGHVQWQAQRKDKA